MVVSATVRPPQCRRRHHPPCHGRCDHGHLYTEDGMVSMTYRASGVDIAPGEALVERIKPMARATSRAGVMGGLGGFGALFDLKAAGYRDPILVSATDGVGTKLKVAIETGKHDTVGIALVPR